MTQQEYSDLIAGQLSPEELQRLTSTYGAEIISSILRGEKQLHDVLASVAQKREQIDDLGIDWDTDEVDRRIPFIARYSGWLIALAGLVLITSLVAILPRMTQMSAETDFSFSDPLPLTIVIVLIIGVAAMIALERNDAG